MAGTMLMAKAPPTMFIRYRTPAILASCFGEVSATESIKDLSQLVLMTLVHRRRRLRGAVIHRRQETKYRLSGDVRSLRLGIVPGLGHHDDLPMHGQGDPVSLRALIRKVG